MIPSKPKAQGSSVPLRPGEAGFTLTELIVAVGLAGILILGIAQVFSSVSRAVETGAASGEVIDRARMTMDRVRRDFEQMVGPREGAVLVIVNHDTGDIGILPSDVENNEQPRSVRTDQLMFIRRRGELQPIAPSGDDSLTNESSAQYVKLWLGHALEADGDGSAPSSMSAPAIDWMLGRQSLFLDSDESNAAAASALASASVDVFTGDPANAALRHGLADVAHYGLAAESSDNDASIDADFEHGAITGAQPPTTPQDGAPLYHDRRLWLMLTAEDYADRAYDYTYAAARLLARPEPTGGSYEAWKVAQMQPVLARNVTDVVVEFAGDYLRNSDTVDDANPPSDATAEADGLIDRYSDSGDVIWYGLTVRPPATSAPETDPGAFVSATSTDQTDRSNPIHDADPAATSEQAINATRGYIFRHGPGRTNWPSMIRIRIRLHDSKGRLRGTDNRPGVWFEQILQVNRNG